MLLQIKNLSITLGKKKIVNSVNLNIDHGQFVALIGESGSGKSMTSQSIIKLREENIAYNGEINFANQNILTLTEEKISQIRGKDIGYVFQNPFTSLNPTQTIDKQIAEVIKIHNHKIAKETLKNRINELLEMVEMNAFKDKLHIFPHQLSGGQQQRIVIAIAIANNPKLLIADEPTTSLDEEIETTIMDLLFKLNQRHRIAILLITHNIKIVKQFAKLIYIIHAGKIIEHGALEYIMFNTNNNYVKTLINNHYTPLVNYYEEWSHRQKILAIKNLNVTLAKTNFSFFKKKHKQILQNINFELHEGETLGVIGKSGSGKSTLAKTLVGLIKNRNDSFQIIGNEITKFTKSERKKIQIVLQDPFDNLNNYLTVFQNIHEGMRAHKIHHNSPQKKLELIHNLLQDVNLPINILEKFPPECSGGERQRICIIRALVLNPKILILDEVTSAIDITTAQNILKILVNLQKKYHTSYIFISHNLQFVAQISHRILVLNKGEIVNYGPTLDILHQHK